MTNRRASSPVLTEWRRQHARRIGILALGCVCLFAGIFASLALGAVDLAPAAVVKAIAARLVPSMWASNSSLAQAGIVVDLRLPRTVMALIAGGGLSVAGAAMQGITRNVLVSPFTLGISPAAAFGASVAIVLGLNALPVAGYYLTVALAFVSAFACASLVLTLSSFGGVRPTVLVLCGVGFTYLFGSLTNTVQFFATDQQLAAIVHWTFGSLNGITWAEVDVSGLIFLLTIPVFIANGRALNAFAAGGDEVAASLGFAVRPIRITVTFATVLLTAGIVSFVGVIGFVGLVGPHIARLLVGGDHRVLLPFAAIAGAILVMVADLIGRLAFEPVIIPVGIVIAYVGVPIFLQLLLTRQREWND